MCLVFKFCPWVAVMFWCVVCQYVCDSLLVEHLLSVAQAFYQLPRAKTVLLPHNSRKMSKNLHPELPFRKTVHSSADTLGRNETFLAQISRNCLGSRKSWWIWISLFFCGFWCICLESCATCFKDWPKNWCRACSWHKWSCMQNACNVVCCCSLAFPQSLSPQPVDNEVCSI